MLFSTYRIKPEITESTTDLGTDRIAGTVKESEILRNIYLFLIPGPLDLTLK